MFLGFDSHKGNRIIRHLAEASASRNGIGGGLVAKTTAGGADTVLRFDVTGSPTADTTAWKEKKAGDAQSCSSSRIMRGIFASISFRSLGAGRCGRSGRRKCSGSFLP